MADNYRLNSELELKPLFISLGLPSTAFKSFNPAIPPSFFDAAVNCGPLHPDSIWLFKGSDYHRYNLRERKFEKQDPISQIAKRGPGNHLPPGFFSGIDTVCYTGSMFPNFFYFFAEETYVRVNTHGILADRPIGPAETFYSTDEGPRGVLGVWAVGVWTNPDGTFTKPGRMVALHGEGSRFVGQVHFFRNGEYVRHDLRNGGRAAGPVPIKDAWKLPAPFTAHIDLAFYGAGPEAQKIYFISGNDFVLYDPEFDQVMRSGRVDQEFPGFASFMNRPQLFLVETDSLRTYLGPLADGNIVDTRSIGPGETLHRVLVIETVESTSSTVKTSLLDQQDSSTVQNFNDRVDKSTSEKEGSESYKYHLQADAHGDAKATGFWGGEVNASLSAQGGTDTLRRDFGQSVFKAVSTQVTESKQQQVARTFSSADQIEHRERVLNIMEFTQQNPTGQIINVGFFNIVQSFAGLMVLSSVRIAYSDGFNPRVVELSELPRLLDDVLAPGQPKEKIISFIVGELSNIVDANNHKQSILNGNGGAPSLNAGMTTVFPFVAPDGTTQNMTVPGIVKSVKTWMNPTRNMIGRNL
jgi:hypothetical protein